MFLLVVFLPFSSGAISLDLSKRGIADDSVADSKTSPRPISVSRIFKKIESDNMLDEIRFINLRGNEISDEGAEVVCSYVSKMPNLEVLDLSCNQIAQAGIIGLVPVILRMENLKVDLTQNYADIGAITYFYDNLRAEAVKESRDFEECAGRVVFFDEGILSQEGAVNTLNERLANHASENWLNAHQLFYENSALAH